MKPYPQIYDLAEGLMQPVPKTCFGQNWLPNSLTLSFCFSLLDSFLSESLSFLEIAGNFTFTILWLCIVSLLNLSAYCCFFDLNFYTMKFSMFSIFRSRSLLASFFSISHVASFVNYFFHLFSSPASGALLPATACLYYQTYPSLSTAFLFFLLLFFLISLFLFYTPPCLPHIHPAYPYLLTFT